MAVQRTFSNGLARTSVTATDERSFDAVEKGAGFIELPRSVYPSLSESSSAKSASTVQPRIQNRKSRTIEFPTDIATYRIFRTSCDRIIEELSKIPRYFHGNAVSDEGVEVVAEVEALLEDLYECRHGQGEILKRIIVAIQSQVNNVQWEKSHAEFLTDIFAFLRVRYLIDESVVATCYDMIKEHGLDPFRGSVATPLAAKRYRIEEIKNE